MAGVRQTLAEVSFTATELGSIYGSRRGPPSLGQAVLDWLWTIFDERRIAWFRDAFVHPEQVKRGAGSQIARTF